MVLYPLMSKHWAAGAIEAAAGVTYRAFHLSMLALAPLVLVMGCLREDFICMAFGVSFLPASAPLAILLVGYLFNGVTSRPLGASMAAIGYPQADFYRSSLAAGINVGLNLLLIPQWGLAGAAWATTTSLVATSLMSVGIFSRLSGIRVPRRSIVVAGALLCVLGLLNQIPTSGLPARLLVASGGAGLLFMGGWHLLLAPADRRYVTSQLELGSRLLPFRRVGG